MAGFRGMRQAAVVTRVVSLFLHPVRSSAVDSTCAYDMTQHRQLVVRIGQAVGCSVAGNEGQVNNLTVDCVQVEPNWGTLGRSTARLRNIGLQSRTACFVVVNP